MYARDKGKKDRNETGILTSRREERAGIGIAIERTHKKDVEGMREKGRSR
jgi:hypothetical protein